MFNTGSTWGNPQGQQQQQQQQPSAFGQPSGFGTGAGTTNAFGQPQQPQQPAANPMFGNFGGSNAGSTGTTGFGGSAAFGANNATAGGGIFGQPKPATGFGGFGGAGTSAFGGTTTGAFGGAGTSGGAFGTNASTSGTGMFGSQPSTSTGAFGNGGGLFGQNKPATAFGSTTNTTDSGPPVTSGTANPPFAPYTEQDAINPKSTVHFQSITAMPAYRSSSFEELRLQDYQQGRKSAAQTSFGSTAQPSTGLFGQPPNQPAATGTTFGGFGNTSTANAGTNSGFGAFGQQPNTTGTTGNLFGGGAAFGQANQQPQQPQQPTGFGAFGQPQNQQTGSSLFGGGGGFGNNQQKPAFGTGTSTFGGNTGTFGQNAQQPATVLFGQTQPQPAGNTFGAFGQNNNQNKPSIFGTAPGTQPTTGFGGAFAQSNPQQPQQQQQGAQPSGGLFNGGNLFGQNNQQQQQQQQPQQPTQGGLFGGQPTQPQAGGSLFGGGLFGTNQQQQQQGAQPQQPNSFGNLFGAPKPATTTAPTGGNMFGGLGTNNTAGQPAQSQPTSGGLFGSSTLGQQPQTQQSIGAFGAGGMFGKPAAPTLGASTSMGQQSGTFGNSLFGSTLGASTTTSLGQSQAPLTASIAQPISTNLPIFSMLPPGPRAVNLDQQQPKKKPGYFVDVPTRAPGPQLQLRYAPATTKLRGFGSTSTPPGAGSSQLSSSLLYTSGKPNALSLSKAATNKSLLGPDAFLTNGRSSPILGSGVRQSVKKLTLDKRVEAADLFSKSTAGVPSFNPKLSIAAREMEAAAAAAANASNSGVSGESPSRAQPEKSASNRFVAQATSEALGTARPAAASAAPAKSANDPAELPEGEYWVKPHLDALKKLGHDQLMSFSGLVVGRVGYGQITFLEPVDLTGLPRLSSLLGEIVRFDDKECSVYPDADEAEKPSAGLGLNVKARIQLERCWAQDKATREPIKDPAHPAAQRYAKRLRGMKHTKFEDLDYPLGKWTFTVEHF